jgi:hypothetical protein
VLCAQQEARHAKGKGAAHTHSERVRVQVNKSEHEWSKDKEDGKEACCGAHEVEVKQNACFSKMGGQKQK